MRKNIFFLILSVFISVLFSCDLQLPTAVEIRGNPDIRIAAAKDIGEAFLDLFDLGSGGDFTLISCTGTETRTYMLHNGTFSVGSSAFPTGSGTVSVPATGHDLGSNDASVSVDFGGVISGFTLQPAIARVFVKGNQNLLDRLSVDITVTYAPSESHKYNKFNRGVSGVSGSTYTGKSMPGSSSTNIPLPLDTSNLKVKFGVSLLPGNYESSWFDEGISSEILVWVPLVFTADDDNAEIAIPPGTLFDAGQDIFGRDSPGDPNPIGDYVESLELSIVLKKNPFDGRDLVIKSKGGIEINHKMRGNAFSFPIDKETMEELNNPSTHPFVPNFTIKYKGGDKLEFPWELSSTTFVFKAKVKYRVDF